MAKKTSDNRPIPKDDPSRILQTTVEDVMHQSMIPYAEHVILERALPRVEDGLKPVQRRILYTMMELGTTPDKPHRKCARIVGDCLGKYHPHGDSSVYDALVRMAQDFSMRGPMVDGHGNFGSIDGDSAAAMRYTEARMTPLALEMLRDIEKDTVPFRLNFDDTLKRAGHAARALSESARQRRERHRGRACNEHPPAQSGRKHPRGDCCDGESGHSAG